MITIPSDFPWRPGMRLLSADGAARVLAVEGGMPTVLAVEGPIRMDRSVGCYVEAWSDDAYHESDRPDIEDAATLGALEGAVAEVHGEPTLHARPVHVDAYDSAEPTIVWHIERAAEDDHEWLRQSGVWGAVEDGHRDPPIVGRSKAEALLAAWIARPGRSA